MKLRKVQIVIGLCTLLLASHASIASAAEIKALITIAMQSVFEELGPQFEKASGHKLAMSFALSNVMAKRIQEDEAADYVVSTRGGVDGLVKSGKILPASDISLVRSSIGIAVRKGAPKPDIATTDASSARYSQPNRSATQIRPPVDPAACTLRRYSSAWVLPKK